VTHSRNRPEGAEPLSSSDLPQLDWAASGAGPRPPPPQLQVDDLLEVLQVRRPLLPAGTVARPC
jgi:hypothetical protein